MMLLTCTIKVVKPSKPITDGKNLLARVIQTLFILYSQFIMKAKVLRLILLRHMGT